MNTKSEWNAPTLYVYSKERNWAWLRIYCTVLLKGRSNFEKSSRIRYIFLKAIFCPKKEKIILKIFGWEKHPLTTISFEISILEKIYRK